jgi:hypothetical protein
MKNSELKNGLSRPMMGYSGFGIAGNLWINLITLN